MTKYDIKQSGGGVHVIGSIDWSPEDWEHQTSDAEVERVLGEVKAKGEVTGYTSFESDEGVSYCFLPDKVESPNPNFIGHLSDYLGEHRKPTSAGAKGRGSYNQARPE